MRHSALPRRSIIVGAFRRVDRRPLCSRRFMQTLDKSAVCAVARASELGPKLRASAFGNDVARRVDHFFKSVTRSQCRLFAWNVQHFDLRTASESEVMIRARPLERTTLGEMGLVGERGDFESSRNKGRFGLLVEQYFRISPNRDQAPDFPSAGIELKVVPMRRLSRTASASNKGAHIRLHDGLRNTDREQWGTAFVRKKVAAVFFVLSDEDKQGVTLLEKPILGHVLWRPGGGDILAEFRRDWEIVWTKTQRRERAWD